MPCWKAVAFQQGDQRANRQEHRLQHLLECLEHRFRRFPLESGRKWESFAFRSIVSRIPYRPAACSKEAGMDRNANLASYLGRMYERINAGDVFSTADDYLSIAEDSLGIGTDPREWWAGADALRAAWNTQLPEMHRAGIRFEPGDIQAFSEGSVGWFAHQPTLKMPDGGELPARVTGVCHRENGAWKLVQFHFSIGVLNEEALGQELTI
jgi:hypothetical protein